MKKGISLIVLIITIVVAIILVMSIVLNFKDENITDKSTELAFKTNLQVYIDELYLYISDKKIVIPIEGKFDETTLNVTGKSDLQAIMPSMGNLSDAEISKYSIKAGKLLFSGTDEENKWASDVGAQVYIKNIEGTWKTD